MKKSEQCPNGLKRTIALFEAALVYIITSDEINHLIKHCGCSERKWLKVLKESITDGLNRTGVSSVNIWAYIPVLQKTPHLLADIIAYMVGKDDMVLSGEELDILFGENSDE